MPREDEDPQAADRPIGPEQLRGISRVGLAEEPVVVGDEEDQIREELETVHLPMLEEAGYVEWDRESGTIEKGPRFEEIESLLERYVEPPPRGLK